MCLQKKELEAELANVSGLAKPTRKIRCFYFRLLKTILPFVVINQLDENTYGLFMVQIVGLILHNHLKRQLKLTVVLFIFIFE